MLSELWVRCLSEGVCCVLCVVCCLGRWLSWSKAWECYSHELFVGSGGSNPSRPGCWAFGVNQWLRCCVLVAEVVSSNLALESVWGGG